MRRALLPFTLAPAARISAARVSARMSTALVPLALVSFVLGLAVSARAQVVAEDPSLAGPELSITIGQRFELDSNLDLDDPSPGTSAFTETRLSFGLLEESEIQSFSLDLETGVRALWPAEGDFEFTFASPSTAAAGYEREWATGDFEAGVAYRQRRVDFARDLFDFIDPTLGEVIVPDDPDELEGDATERRYDASFGLALATDAPSSYTFGLNANRIDYDEATTTLTPRTSVQGNATWTLALHPLFSGTLSARGFYYEADNAEETEIREAEIDAGVVYDPTEVLRVSAGIGVVDRERRARPGGVGPVETVESGTGLSLRTGVNYAFDDFQVNAGLRVATTPETRLSGNFSLVYPLENGLVNARAFQSFAGGTGGDEIRVLGAGIGLQRELDQVSRINFDLAATRRTNEDDPADPDIDRIDFTTVLQYDFTEAVSADFGYRYRSIADGPSDADSHAVFVEVGRTFASGF